MTAFDPLRTLAHYRSSQPQALSAIMPADSDYFLPRGFRFSGITAGIKASGKPDLALLVSEKPTVAAAVLTTNLIRAASIDWCREIFPSDNFRAVIVNSGNANACTGEQGKANNLRISHLLGEELGLDSSNDGCRSVAVLSTGIIGHQLPIEKIQKVIPSLVKNSASTENAFADAARAITTTDNAPKTASLQFSVENESYSIAVMAKGAGMIGPNMATMLCVAVTDFPLTKDFAQHALTIAANQSFNAISVEGHMSTNDAMILMTSASTEAMEAEASSIFQQHLNEVTLKCAKMIPADGEGATHLVKIQINGTTSDRDADRIARSIANSALVKSAFYGNDPNWGRIVSAAGYAGVEFDPASVSLDLNGTRLFQSGTPTQFDAKTVSRSMREHFETSVVLTVGEGRGTATHWTSDLTVDYVRFNSDYST